MKCYYSVSEGNNSVRKESEAARVSRKARMRIGRNNEGIAHFIRYLSNPPFTVLRTTGWRFDSSRQLHTFQAVMIFATSLESAGVITVLER